jgi:hypothetical protein
MPRRPPPPQTHPPRRPPRPDRPGKYELLRLLWRRAERAEALAAAAAGPGAARSSSGSGGWDGGDSGVDADLLAGYQCDALAGVEEDRRRLEALAAGMTFHLRESLRKVCGGLGHGLALYGCSGGTRRQQVACPRAERDHPPARP